MWTPIEGVIPIGLGHKARHGKDSAANFIHQRFPSLTRQYAFADDLKAYCRIAFDMIEKDGSLLQMVGVAMREKRDKDIWVRSVYAKLREQRPAFALVTDMRFKNEAQLIKDLGGFTVNVSRLNGDGSPFVTTDRDPNHVSETELDGFDYDYRITESQLTGLERSAIAVFLNIQQRVKAAA